MKNGWEGIIRAFFVLATLCACAGALRAEAPFSNSDFEQGTFENWPEHFGWRLGGKLEVGPYDYRNVFPEITGYFVATTGKFRDQLITRMTGKADRKYPKRLISVPFEITRPYLVFAMTGEPAGDKNAVGVDLTGDGVPDVKLAEKDQKRLRKACPHSVTYCLDLSDHVGKKARFAAIIKERHLSFDRLTLEPEPPLAIRSLAVEQNHRRAIVRVETANIYKAPSSGSIALRVLDYYGKVVLKKTTPLRVAGGKTEESAFVFPIEVGPDYRVRCELRAETGTLLEIQNRRFRVPRLDTGRKSLLVHDGWEVTVTDDKTIQLPPTDARWRPESPVGPSGSFKYRLIRWWNRYEKNAQAWYRRTFTYPSAELGSDGVYLRLDGGGDGILKVFVNGHPVDERLIHRYTEEVFDLSALLKKGANDIVLRFRNPAAYLKVGGTAQETEFSRPVRYYWGVPMGIFGYLYLEGRPRVYCDRVLVDPSYRAKSLTARLWVRNARTERATAEVSAAVFDKEGKKVLNVGKDTIDIAAGAEIPVRFTAPWADPILWSLESPELLRLRVLVTSAGKTDVSDTRFGFREFELTAKDMLLNGNRLTILDGLAEPHQWYAIHKIVYGQNAVRFPLVGFFDAHYADELGILTRAVMQSILPPKRKDISSAYWNEFAATQMAEVRYRYNHPSIYMWNVGNELFHPYLRTPLIDTFKPLYCALAARIQALDPMRAATSDGDMDMFGVSRMWNPHYPHERGSSDGMPNKAFWLKPGIKFIDWIPSNRYQGKKPVFLGEAFSGGIIGPDWMAPFAGDRAYRDADGLFDAYTEWMLLRMRAYREQHIVGYEPFDMFLLTRDFFPIDVYPREYHRRVFAGGSFSATVQVHNAIQSPKKLKLKWTFGDIASGEMDVYVKAGESKAFPLRFRLPKAKERRDVELRLTLLENGRPFPRTGAWRGEYSVIPPRRLSGTIGVSGVSGAIADMLKDFGLKTIPIAAEADLSRCGLIVTSGKIFDDFPEAADAWLREGGYLLVLDQTKQIDAIPLQLNEFSNTKAHLCAASNPLLAGVRKGDLHYWAGDNYVSRRSYGSPLNGDFQVLCQTGDINGLRMTPFIELTRGKGRILCCSLLLAEKYRDEPIVGVLLENILKRAQTGAPKKHARAGTLLGGSMLKRLKSSGCVVDDLAATDKPRLGDYDLLWVDAGISKPDVKALRSFVEAGGTLILSRIDPAVDENYKELIPFRFTLNRSPRGVAWGGEMKIKTPSPLVDGLSHFDLFWKRGLWRRNGPQMRVTCDPIEFSLRRHPRDKCEVTEILAPGALLETRVGKGRLILDQIRWEEAFEREDRSLRVFHSLLHNLRLPRDSSATRFKETEFASLAIPANRRAAADVLPGVTAKADNFPRGDVRFHDAHFKTPPSGPDFLALGAPGSLPGLPRNARIVAERRADALFFWHAVGFGFIDVDVGKPVVTYTIHYLDGSKTFTEKVVARYGVEVYEYLGGRVESLTGATQVTRRESAGLSSYLMRWKNPHPDALITAIDAETTHKKVAAFVFGVACEKRKKKTVRLVSRRSAGLWSVNEADRYTEIGDKGRVWAILMCFDNKPPKRGGFDKVWPPERNVDLSASYSGMYNRKVRWIKHVEPIVKKKNTRSFIQLDHFFDFKTPADLEYYTGFAYTRIKSPEDKKVIVAFGSDDGSKLWINGKLVRDKWVARGCFLGQDLFVVKLKKGWNDVLVKVVNCFREGGFAFDLKEYDEKTIEAWKRDWRSLAPLPSLEYEYDAFSGDDGKSAKHPHAAGRGEKTVSRVMTARIEGASYNLSGVTEHPSAVSREDDAVCVNFSKGPGAGIRVDVPQRASGDKTLAGGAFRMSFLVPKGASALNTFMVTRNLGGANLGDILVLMQGGSPSPKYGGKSSKTPKPCDRFKIVLQVDSKDARSEIVRVKGGIAEGVWHTLHFTWGKAGKPDGFHVFFDNKEILGIPEYTGPAFNVKAPIILVADGYKRGEGAILVKDVLLTERKVLPSPVQ